MTSGPLTFSTYSGLSDLDRIRSMVSSCWQTLGVNTQLHIGNLGWRLASVDLTEPYEGIGIWSNDEGRVVALALVYDLFPVDLLIDPQVNPGEELTHALLDWTESRWRSAVPAGSSTRRLRVGCLESDAFRRAVLDRRGYAMAERSYLRFACRIADHSAVASLPEGLRLQALQIPDDLGRLKSLHNTVFDAPLLTGEDCERIASVPWYRQELCCLVENPAGEPVSFALGWIDALGRALEFEPVGCHPDWRRKGITGALLHEIMRRAGRAGAVVASVTARADNQDTIAFYHAAGFRNHMTEFVFVEPSL
jgi:GNAT superfamily N-acetyltransferase